VNGEGTGVPDTRPSYFEHLLRWVGASHEERRVTFEYQVIDVVYDIHDQPHEERVWLVSAREIEQYSNREGEGDEGGYASIERVVEFGHHDLENACSYVLTELEVTL